jgi:type IV secretory pathway VirB6-like protein
MASFFDESGQVESALLANDFSNKSVIFGGTDRVIALFINNDVIHKKILSLLFYKFFGILYTMIIYYSAVTYVYAISNAVLIYLTSQFFISILFSVGPFFFVFILFKQTKTFFDNWINSLIGFALQQIFLIFTLSLFNSFLYLIIKLTLGYRICWDSVWEINILSSKISLLSFWTPQEAPSYISNTMDPTTSGTPSGIPTLPKLLSLWSLCVIMKSFLGQITDLVALLSGGVSATELGTGIAGSMNKAIGSVKEKVSKAYNKSGLKAMERIDQKFFDSGSLAKNARKKAKATDDQNRNLKSKMLKDGNKAVSDYKTNKSEEFSKLTEAGKRAKLADVKKNAMINTAKQAGKGDKSIEKLMSSTKGSSYKGDNVFGFAASHALDYLRNNKTSMNAKAASVDTGMSKSEMKTAMKNLDGPEKRQNFMDSVKDGRIQQKESGVRASLNDATKADVSREERSTAVKQLEKSGEISKQTYDNKPMTGGGKANNVSNAIDNFAGNAKANLVKRSPEEESKILAKVQENRLAQSFDKGSNMSGKNIDKLESFAKYLDKKDNKGDVEDRVKEKEDSKKPNEENAKNIDKDVNDKAVNTLISEKDDNNKAIEGAKEKLDSSKGALDNAQKAINGSEYHKKMDALKSKIDKGENVTSEDRKDFQKLSDKDGGKVGEEFGDKITARSKASSEVAKNEANLNNLEVKGAKIDTALHEAQSKQGSNVADSVVGGAEAPPPAGGDAEAKAAPAGGGAEAAPAGATPAPAGDATPAGPDGATLPPESAAAPAGGAPPKGAAAEAGAETETLPNPVNIDPNPEGT